MKRLLLVSLATLVLLALAVFTAAWLSSPAPSSLGRRVDLRLRAARGKPVPLTSVSPILREAVVATEDERFYSHHGIDLLGLVRAIPYDLFHLTTAEGASTITEQVGKLVYLNGNDHNPWRKLEDMALALKLESRYSKEQILAAYLNDAYFGEGAYGVWAASERYFGLAPAKLDAARASLLAGLVQAPSAYDPFLHPAAARERQVAVLRSLVRNGYLAPEEASVAAGRPLRLGDGHLLPAVRGIDFLPGPAFVWWELALGIALVLAGIVAVVAFPDRRLRRRLRVEHGLLAVRFCSLVLVLVGADVVARSFRVI
jgi:hypothetical protein